MIQNISANQLRNAADLMEKIEGLQNELASILGGSEAAPARRMGRPPGSGNKAKAAPVAGKRVMSEAAKAKIRAAAKARWKAARAAGKNTL